MIFPVIKFEIGYCEDRCAKQGKEPGWWGGTTRGELNGCQHNHGRVVTDQNDKMRRKIW